MAGFEWNADTVVSLVVIIGSAIVMAVAIAIAAKEWLRRRREGTETTAQDRIDTSLARRDQADVKKAGGDTGPILKAACLEKGEGGEEVTKADIDKVYGRPAESKDEYEKRKAQSLAVMRGECAAPAIAARGDGEAYLSPKEVKDGESGRTIDVSDVCEDSIGQFNRGLF